MYFRGALFVCILFFTSIVQVHAKCSTEQILDRHNQYKGCIIEEQNELYLYSVMRKPFRFSKKACEDFCKHSVLFPYSDSHSRGRVTPLIIPRTDFDQVRDLLQSQGNLPAVIGIKKLNPAKEVTFIPLMKLEQAREQSLESKTFAYFIDWVSQQNIFGNATPNTQSLFDHPSEIPSILNELITEIVNEVTQEIVEKDVKAHTHQKDASKILPENLI